MQDIKRKPKKSLSFLEELPGGQGIEQPASFFKEWLSQLVKKPAVFYGLLGAVIIIALAISFQFSIFNFQSPRQSELGAQSANPSGQISNIPNGNRPLFQPDVFYRVELLGGLVYYARVAAASWGHYRLTNVFYEDAAEGGNKGDGEGGGKQEERAERIMLVKFGTEADQPQDELVVPREQVKLLTPLSDSSPVVKAIKEYLLERSN